jgi:2-dehydropantoate 2-reductase
MKEYNPKILVIGAGAIGGITAANSARHGYDIEIVDNLNGLSHKINNEGLIISGVCGNFTQKLKAYSAINEIRSPKDIIFIATKATALEEISKAIVPLLKSDSVVVSLQNGICEDYLCSEFGSYRVIGCIVGWGATVLKPGELEMTSDGEFIIGNLSEKHANHFDFVKEILNTFAKVRVSSNIYGELYSKLIINSCITTLGAICGLKLGEMLSKRKVRNIFIDVIREAVRVGIVSGYNIEKYANKLDFYYFYQNRSRLSNLKKHALIKIIGYKYRKLKSSSLQSLEAGNRTEIDYLNGFIVRKAREYNISTPLNDYLVKLLKEIESGMRIISPDNFNEESFIRYN